MNKYISDLPEKFGAINVNKSGDKRSPHKPLLLLIALAKLQQGQREITFSEIEGDLSDLLSVFGPPTKRVQPELPFWHLCTDKIWSIDDAEGVERQASGFPKLSALRASIGSFTDDVIDALEKEPSLITQLSFQLLDEYFSPTLHDDIIASVGLTQVNSNVINESALGQISQRKRDPDFRRNVLSAYEHRCAVTGFRAALNGRFVGCEAAHVRWHALNGPDDTSNGLALEPTIHKLFDLGAWSLSDERKIIVSSQFTGDDIAISRLRSYHGKSIVEPLPGAEKISVEFIKWHREEDKGGVFKGPGLPV